MFIINDNSYSECTDVEKEHVSYNWTLSNVNLILNGAETKVSSPHFSTRNSTDKWRIDFYPTGWKTDDNDWSSLYLQLVSSQKLGLNAQWRMMLYKSGRLLKSFDYSYVYKIPEGYGRQYFVKRADLLIGDGHEITIRCELDLPLRIIEVPCKKTNVPAKLAFDLQEHKLVDDFRSLFQNMTASDVTVVAEDQTFPAHKAVLIARSPIFADILKRRENEEVTSNVIVIENMTPAEVTGMMEFLYTDNVTGLDNLAHGLLAADTLMFAHLYHSNELKRFTLEFITEHLAEVSLTEGYKKMMSIYPVLLGEVIQLVAPKMAEAHSS